MMRHLLTFTLVLFLSFDALSEDANEADIYGNLPLGAAASRGEKERCQKLIAQGALVNGKDSRGKTALHLASSFGHLPVCEILILHKAGVNELDVQDYTPLHYAAENGYEKVCEFLRTHGADISLVSQYREIPIEVAQRYNERGSHDGVIECLSKSSRYSSKPSAIASTRRADDCGDWNGASCSASAGRVTWSIGNRAWREYKFPDADCQAEGETWKCKWATPHTTAVYLASAPCIDFQKGQTWNAGLRLLVELSAPEPGNELAGYPYFVLNVGLVSENYPDPLVVERLELSKIKHDQWRWHIDKDIALSANTQDLQTDLKCAHVAVWVSNRLKDSKLKGTIEVKRAFLTILYDHPKPNVIQLNPGSRVSQRQDLLNCPASGIGGYASGCLMSEGVIEGTEGGYGAIVIFHADYVHTCTGTPLVIGICTGEEGERAEFVSDGSQSAVELRGRGPFYFRDFNGPAYTSKAVLSNPCTIRISGIHTRAVKEGHHEEF